MTTLQTVLITGTCLLLLLSLMAVLALPGLRLRQVGRIDSCLLQYGKRKAPAFAGAFPYL